MGDRSVAVKVLHPGVRESIRTDLDILQALACGIDGMRWLGTEWFAVPQAAREFEGIMMEQIDLRVEGRNLEDFRRDFEGSRYVTFPEPIIATEEVLVESYEEGKR